MGRKTIVILAIAIIISFQYFLIPAFSENLPSTEVMNKRVYVLVYDPILSNSLKLSEYMGWYDYSFLTNQLIDYFKTVTDNRLIYSVAFTTEVSDWPELIDGFKYTEETYFDVYYGITPHHEPSRPNYYQFTNNPIFDVCGKLNRGEIDELWIFADPYSGLYESRLAGPGAFWYNSLPLPGTDCERLIPIMGFNYVMPLVAMVEDFGHRTVSTMDGIYGFTQQNRTDNNWDRFRLVNFLSPDYDYSGCGSVHFPPNGTYDYDYKNPDSTNTNCDDFFNYPNLGDPEDVKVPVTCTAWGCDHLGYFSYWFNHIPKYFSVAPDGHSNDWWQYIADPNLVYNPYKHLSEDVGIEKPATFRFEFAGSTSGFHVDISTSPDMSNDVYLHFADGVTSPLVESDPTKWGKFTCNQEMYWRVTSNSGIQSPIQSVYLWCDPVFLPEVNEAFQ